LGLAKSDSKQDDAGQREPYGYNQQQAGAAICCG
jgi:hypothetical protein